MDEQFEDGYDGLPEPEQDQQEPVVKILNDAGYTAFEGKDSVLQMIKDAADDSTEHLCSGYRVFPSGEKCPGCSDCKQDQQDPCSDCRGYREAVYLAEILWKQYYREDAPEWSVLGDTAGVITQIDNMVSGLTKAGQQSKPCDCGLEPILNALRNKAMRRLISAHISLLDKENG